MDMKTLAAQNEAYIIERRRFYHTCPELSGEEKNTRAHIKADLEALGITDITEMQTCYGLTATIHGGKPGKTVALRTDTDGLKVDEKTGLPFASCNGAMHACGHDCHIAMLLGAAKLLQENRAELSGNVKLLIQPAEEIAAGAKAMVAEGVMDGVDAIYGAHIWGNFDAPLVDFSAGNRMAGCDIFTLTVDGVAAHGSAPHLGVDAIAVSAAIIMNIQQYVSRINDPINPLVVTIGEIHGGTRFNTIPNRVVMEGCTRTFSTDKGDEKVIRKIAENTAAAFGAKATLDYHYMTIPVINKDEQLNRIAQTAVKKLYGEASLGQLPILMGSEDFSWFGERVPYVFGFIGSRNEKKSITYTNHHEMYDVDEDVLQRGAAVMAQFAADYLAETGK